MHSANLIFILEIHFINMNSARYTVQYYKLGTEMIGKVAKWNIRNPYADLL